MGSRTNRFLLWLPRRLRLALPGSVGAVAVLLGCGLGPLEMSALAGGPDPSAVAAPAPLAPPGDALRQQVRQLVHEAGQLMDRGDRAGAVARLQQAQALLPDPSIDYNLGIVYAELGQHAQAAQALHHFLASADRSAVLKERLDDALHRLDDYKRTLSRLKIQASLPPQAGPPTLFLDQDRAASRPVSKDAPAELPTKLPLWLSPGTHQVRVAASGARDYVVQVELHPGELRQLTAELLPAGEVSTLVPSSPELRQADAANPLYKKWWFWTAVGGGGAAVLGLSIGLIAAGATGKLSHTAAGSDLSPVDVSR